MAKKSKNKGVKKAIKAKGKKVKISGKQKKVKTPKKSVKAAIKPQEKAQKQKKVVVDWKHLMQLEEATKYILDLSGEEGLKIFQYLLSHGTTEENKLAKKMGFDKTNSIRKYLYTLYSRTLVSYNKKKKGKKAWFIYSWYANPDRLIYLLKEIYQNDINQINKSIELNKVEDYYICNSCNRLYDVSTALQNDFRCPNCGTVLEHIDTAKVLESRQNRIHELKKKIEYLDSLIKVK